MFKKIHIDPETGETTEVTTQASRERPRLLPSGEWVTEVLKALGLEASKNRRLIIDCEVGKPIRIYLENFGDKRLWNVRMPPLEIVQIVSPAAETPDAE